MTRKELQDKRAKLAKEMRDKAEAFNAAGKKWKDGEERKAWEKINADYREVMAQLEAANVAEEVDSRLKELDEYDERSTNPDNKPGMDDTNPDERNERRSDRRGAPDEETRCLAMAGWLRGRMDLDVTERHTQAMRECGYRANGQKGVWFQNPTNAWFRSVQRLWNAGNIQGALDRVNESRAMSDVQFNIGGALVPHTFIRQLEVNMLSYSGIMQVATILTTTDGGTLTMPTADDTSNVGARIGENTAPTGTATPTFGGVQWGDYKYTSNPVLVPNELLQDAFMDLPGFLADALSERIGRKFNTDFTVGTGINGPKGIMTCATSGRTSGTANAISYDDIIYLEHSIDAAYRAGCRFMGNDSVALACRLLKDSNGRYLWTYGVDAGKPDTLDGKPFTINTDMDSAITTGKKPLIYGRLDKYIIRRIGPNRFYHLAERYRDTDQDGFLAFARADGNLLNAGTANVKYLTIQ